MQASSGEDALEEDLVLRMGRGDRQALAKLFERRGSELLRLGCNILRNRAEAEDLLHEVFLEAWRACRQYDPKRGTVRAWLTVRMRSRCLDKLKSAERARTVHLEDDSAQAKPGADESTNQDPSLQTEYARMIAALEELAPDVREVLTLGYFEGLSCSEIAERTGAPVGTVKSRVRRGLAELRERLGVRESGREGVGT